MKLYGWLVLLAVCLTVYIGTILALFKESMGTWTFSALFALSLIGVIASGHKVMDSVTS